MDNVAVPKKKTTKRRIIAPTKHFINDNGPYLFTMNKLNTRVGKKIITYIRKVRMVDSSNSKE